MSFILDALKKSENERARQNGPALLEARVVPRRRGPPLWAFALGAILLVNLGVLAYVLLRPAAPPVMVAAPPPVAAQPVAAPPVAPAAPQPTTQTPTPGTTIALPPLLPEPLPQPDTLAQGNAPVVNPADYQPARPASAEPRLPRGTTGPRGTDSNLPTAAELGVTGLPELRLALHAYDDDPASRYVLLNSQRLREGDSTTDGVRVERITPDNVVLSWRGQQFRLQPGE